MGARAAIDIVCSELVGDAGTFDQKFNALADLGKLSTHDIAIVKAAVNVGNASAHRGHIPTQEDVDSVVQICERLVEGHYILPSAASRLSLLVCPLKG